MIWVLAYVVGAILWAVFFARGMRLVKGFSDEHLGNALIHTTLLWPVFLVLVICFVVQRLAIELVRRLR